MVSTLHALDLDGVPRPPQRTDSAAFVLHGHLSELVIETRHQDGRVRREVPGGVHDMRVNVRMLRSVLTSYRRMFVPAATRPVVEELRWFAGQLGGPRDLEVARECLSAALDEDGDLVLRARRSIERELAAATFRSRNDLTRAMESVRYDRLSAALHDLVTDPPWRPLAQLSADRVLRQTVADQWDRLLRRTSGAAESADPTTHEVALHDVRKAAKRARYATEPLEAVYGKEARRLRRAATRIQSALGDHQDYVTTRAFLRGLAAQPGTTAEVAFVLGRLDAQQQARAADAEVAYDLAVRDAVRASLRSWLRTPPV